MSSKNGRRMRDRSQRIRRKILDFRMTRARRRHSAVGAAGLWKMKRRFQIGFLRDRGLNPDQDLLDLGCGTLRGGIPIIDYLEPCRYTGLDVRADVIEEARLEVAEAHLEGQEPDLVVAPTLDGLDLGRRFDIIWGFQVIIHMTDELLAGAAEFIALHLRSHGKAYVTVRVGPPRSKEWRGFPAVRRPLEFYEERFGAAGLRVLDIGPLTDFGHDIPGRTIEQQAAQRMLLLEQAG